MVSQQPRSQPGRCLPIFTRKLSGFFFSFLKATYEEGRFRNQTKQMTLNIQSCY